MSAMTIKWGFDDLDHPIHDGGYQRDPRWPLVEHFLNQLEFREGNVRLDISDKQGEGAYMLDVVGEEGKYYPTLLYRMADGHPQSRVYDDKSKGTDLVDVRGESYYDCNVIQDFALIHRMFKEFYETGSVSEDMLK
jgi:hypothetical protein